MKSDFYDLAKDVLKRKTVDLHLPEDKLYVCKAREYFIAYVHLSGSMIPLGILEESKKEGKGSVRIQVHPFDSNEIEKAADNICLCGTDSSMCVVKPAKKKTVKKVVKKTKKRK